MDAVPRKTNTKTQPIMTGRLVILVGAWALLQAGGLAASLLCPPQAPTTVYSLQDPLCQESRLFRAEVERRAVSEFTTPLNVVDQYRSVCTTRFFFFGSYYQSRENNQLVPSIQEATHMVLNKSLPTLQAQCEYFWTQTVTTEAVYYVPSTGRALTVPGGTMRSAVGNTEHCVYTQGLCVLSTGRVLWWAPDRKYSVVSEPLGQEDIEIFEGFVRSAKHQTDLKILSKNGTTVTTEAGLTFHLLTPLKQHVVAPRSVDDSGERYHWEEVGSRFSYLLHSVQGAFTGYNRCTLSKSLLQFDSLVSSISPTLWARRHLRNPNLIARKAGEHLLVQECIPVEAHLAPLREQCYQYPRIEYRFHHVKRIGFVHPTTGVIHNSSPLIRCSRRVEVVELGGKVSVLRGEVILSPQVKNLTGDPWRSHPSGPADHHPWWYSFEDLSRTDMSHEVIVAQDERIRLLEQEAEGSLPSSEKGISSLFSFPHVSGWWKLTVIKDWVFHFFSVLGFIAFCRRERAGPGPQASSCCCSHRTVEKPSTGHGLSRASYRRSITWVPEQSSADSDTSE